MDRITSRHILYISWFLPGRFQALISSSWTVREVDAPDLLEVGESVDQLNLGWWIDGCDDFVGMPGSEGSCGTSCYHWGQGAKGWSHDDSCVFKKIWPTPETTQSIHAKNMMCLFSLKARNKHIWDTFWMLVASREFSIEAASGVSEAELVAVRDAVVGTLQVGT